jgi:hypothetical protein
MPVKLMQKWAAIPGGEKRIRKAEGEAEEVFLKVYFENKIEQEGRYCVEQDEVY